MPNPNENNSPPKNKEKANKEFAQENETPQRENINLESNYKSPDGKPMSINVKGANESRAVGNNSPESNVSMGGDWSDVKKQESSTSMGSMSGANLNKNSKGKNSAGSMSGAMTTKPKDYKPTGPEGKEPKVDSTPSSKMTEPSKETTDKDIPKGKTPPKAESKGAAPKKEDPEEKEEIVVAGELGVILGSISAASEKEKVSTDGSEEEGEKKDEEAKAKIKAANDGDPTPENPTGASAGGGTSESGTNSKSTTNTEGKKEGPTAEEKDQQDRLGAFDVTETKEEIQKDTEAEEVTKAGMSHGLIVGRSIGYGAKIDVDPENSKKFTITKFSENEDPSEELTAKDKYNKDNDKIAKNMENTGDQGGPAGDEKETEPAVGYFNAYIKGYNEGHVEGSTLKKEAAVAERTAQMKEEQGTDEYVVGASLGMLCGTLTAKGEKEVDTTFSMTKDGELEIIELKTTVAKLDSAAFDNKQTPGGELSGTAYEKAFVLHYNMGYREAQQQRTQAPPMDEDYRVGYEQGYKLGNQKASGAECDPALLKIEATNDAKDQQALKKDELQGYRGFYAGYNKGYAQVAENKKSKAKKEREKKNNDPDFVTGYSTGNLKGFLTAMIEPSGIDLTTALKSTAKMEEAGIPDYFPIPDGLKENIQGTLTYGEVADNASGGDKIKILLGKPLFKEGLLFGYNQGYSQGLKSRAAFKRDKHKMHPDYQESLLVLMVDKDAQYTGPVGDGSFKTGLAIGQILANTEFEVNELKNKKGASKEDQKRLGDLTTALAGLNGYIGKKSSYYQSGVMEFYNWWMKIVTKKARDKKVQEGYSGGDGSPKRLGFEWGMKVGAQVIKGKEKIKELNRKGHDIKARNTALNNAIKKEDKKAGNESKAKGGQDYLIGYRNGYNHAFRLAKEGKKSDKGNLTKNELENAEKGEYVADICAIMDKVDGAKIDQGKLGTAVKTVKEKFESKTKTAFEDGLTIGYNLGYSSSVVDVKTGETPKKKEVETTQIKDQFKKYKDLKDKDGNKIDDSANGVLYFFLVGYQYPTEKNAAFKYGLPKGVADAKSFNAGYNVAVGKKDKEGDIVSKDAYNAGKYAGEHQVRYADFKKGMVQSVVDASGVVSQETGDNSTKKENETDNTEPKSKVDTSLTGGIDSLLSAKELAAGNKKEEAVDSFYQKGNEDAVLLWTKVVYMRQNIHLEGAEIPEDVAVNLWKENADSAEKPVTIGNDEDGMSKANEYYANQDTFVGQVANYHLKIESKEKPIGDAFNKAKQSYIDGYKAKIKSIEALYKEQFINNWLYDLAYYFGVTEVAPETPLEMPGSPYADMNTSIIDETNPHFKKGFLEGLKKGNALKTGLVQSSDADLAKASGAEYNNGFKKGQKEGSEIGKSDAKNPKKTPPLESALLEKLDADYEKKQKAKNEERDGMDYDYNHGYIKGYFPAYWEIRSYKYGRALGNTRGMAGGNAMFDSKPEEGALVEDKNAFFRGFNEGRDLGVAGLSIEVLDSKEEKEEDEPSSYGTDYASILLKRNTGSEKAEGANTGSEKTGSEKVESAKTGSEKVESANTGSEKVESENTGSKAVLKKLLVEENQDFDLSNAFLLNMFSALKTEISEEKVNIEKLLEEIEEHRSSDDPAQEEWEAAEAAAKQKINSIGNLMKDKLGFDTPINLTEDILTNLKVNLESSKGNAEDIYKDYDIFEDVILNGAFNYQESERMNVSISGNADLNLKESGSKLKIDNVSISMENNGFELKAKGLLHDSSSITTFMDGSIVTPRIEGGEHVQAEYKYSFNDFNILAGQGIKSQIDAQKHNLEGGPV